MSCGCGDIKRCDRCFETWFRAQIASMTPAQLRELHRRVTHKPKDPR